MAFLSVVVLVLARIQQKVVLVVVDCRLSTRSTSVGRFHDGGGADERIESNASCIYLDIKVNFVSWAQTDLSLGRLGYRKNGARSRRDER